MSVYTRIKERLEKKELIFLDGPVGTELVRRGIRWRQHGMRTDAERVLAIQREYIAAGADVIRTNTFQLNPRTYANLFRDLDHMRRIGAEGLEQQAGQLIRKAVRLALEAREGSEKDRMVAVAGSVSPLNHCFRPDLAPSFEEARKEHAEIIGWMKEEGVDFVLLESMNTVSEARAAARSARDAGLPFWVSFVIGPEGNVLSGEDLSDALEAIVKLGPDAILVNCGPPEEITKAVTRLRQFTDLPIGAYAHIGRYDPPSWKFEFFPHFVETDAYPPEAYARHAGEWVRLGAGIIGGCCGTTLDHIRALREALVRSES